MNDPAETPASCGRRRSINRRIREAAAAEPSGSSREFLCECDDHCPALVTLSLAAFDTACSLPGIAIYASGHGGEDEPRDRGDIRDTAHGLRARAEHLAGRARSGPGGELVPPDDPFAELLQAAIRLEDIVEHEQPGCRHILEDVMDELDGAITEQLFRRAG